MQKTSPKTLDVLNKLRKIKSKNTSEIEAVDIAEALPIHARGVNNCLGVMLVWLQIFSFSARIGAFKFFASRLPDTTAKKETQLPSTMQ